MSTRRRVVRADPQQVWRVLADGWLYPLFVVGASRMRDVDDSWPAPGSRLHHSVGAWPALIDDITEVLECDPGSRLRLSAHGWPAGRAEVELRVTACPEGAEVTIAEDVVSGPGRLVPRLLRDPQISWRNVETLRRLAYSAERRE
ncbi:MAG: SRPBCC family protein [Nocardioides sp.]|uniref:SRPBCC family protein n=1 Tax=Nocardioides sp. TaxID=35761 RepID=UPI00238C0712|nr:SRPBCC family protein [Nocardioides sp.]MDE0775839.1 SRPBCC family protein [Nocardioides sp.]